MLRRYEALGGSVVLPLSKRVASLLSMVFYAKAANPQELVVIEMGNHAWNMCSAGAGGRRTEGGRCGLAGAGRQMGWEKRNDAHR